LDQLEKAVTAPAPFRPATSQRVFRVATFDYFELAVLPDLLRRLARQAPHVGLDVERFLPAQWPSLVAGEIDLALVGDAGVPTPGLRRAEIFAEPFEVLVRDGHPQVKRRLDLETYLALGHVLVTIEGRRDGAVDRALAKLGRTRRVVVRVPHFLSAPLAVLGSDHICTVPSRVAARARELYPLRALPVPLEVQPAPIVAFWSRRTEADVGAKWFRELVLSL
jgi:DNA-binding transcriptional LysR family regulator